MSLSKSLSSSKMNLNVPVVEKPDNFEPDLFKSIEKNNVESVKYILSQEQKPNLENKNNSGDTPLIVAAGKGNVEICRILLENGANIEIRSDYFNTPLLEAAQNSKLDTIKFLVESGANIDARSKNGRTPLMFASE